MGEINKSPELYQMFPMYFVLCFLWLLSIVVCYAYIPKALLPAFIIYIFIIVFTLLCYLSYRKKNQKDKQGKK